MSTDFPDAGLHGCSNEPTLLINALLRYPQRIAMKIDGEEITYRQLYERISQCCQALQKAGVKRAARVGLLSGNRPEVVLVNAALGVLGCCLVPLHPRGSLEDHQFMAEDAGLAFLIFDSAAFAERAAKIAAAKRLKLISIGPSEIGVDLSQALRACTPAALASPTLKPTDFCRLSYSGGTTGRPKAIIGTPEMLLTKTIIQLIEWDWPSEIRQLIVTPLSHAGGSMVLPTLVKGGTLVVLPKFDPALVLRTIQEQRITCVLLVPTMINALLDSPEIDTFDLSSLQAIYYGASPISPARLRQAIEKFGPVFFQFYGQTEAPMTVTVMRRDEHDIGDDQRLASCGRPVSWVRVALLDDSGEEAADGEPGEICVRGPLVMSGYLNQPEQTAQALADNWLHTGDIAIRAPDGFLRIVDRKKDMIITGGYNVFAREVEDIICEHPAVAACGVVGVPDPHWGEAVKAFVELKAGTHVAADDLIRMVRTRKGAVQAPKLLEFLDQLPLTGLGKPDKKALRARTHASSR